MADSISILWPLFLFFGCWGLILVGRNIKAKTRLKENEMIHRERIEAMQKGLPVPPYPELPSVEPSTRAVDWVRMISLVLGLLFLFTGIGMCAAFLIEPDWREVWPMGLVPAMAGIGFLLFYNLSRGFTTTSESS